MTSLLLVAVCDLFWITCHLVSAAFSATEVFLENNGEKNRKLRIPLINIKGARSFRVTLLPGYQCWRVTDQQSGAE